MDNICCIHCHKGSGEDHRWCLVELFKTNKIKTVAEWQEQSRLLAKKMLTVVKGRVRIRVAVE